MKKQASDQSFHDRRYQERKRAEAAKKAAPKKVVGEKSENRVASPEHLQRIGWAGDVRFEILVVQAGRSRFLTSCGMTKS